MLYAIHGKGGAGKSTIARYLVHRALARKEDVRAFDADASNGTLTRFYKDHTTRVSDPHPAALGRWLEEVVWPAAATGTAVLDLGSGAERIFAEWAAASGLLAVAAEARVPVLLVGVLDPSKDALAPLLAAFRHLPDGQHVAVRNSGRAKPGEGFEVIDGHSAWGEVKKSARVVDMPILAVTAPKIDALNASFADAIAGCVRDGVAQLGPFDRQRVVQWLRIMDTAWEGL